MHITTDDGARLLAESAGDPASPLLVALHGAPGLGSHLDTSRSFGRLAHSLRVVTYDARGCGASSLTPPYTHERWAADVDCVRAWAGAERFVLAGGSYGGFIALEYALRHPERVSALVLRDTAAHNGFDAAARRNALASPRIQVDLGMFERIFSGRVRDDSDLEACWRHIVPLYDHDPDPARVEARLGNTVYHAQTHNAAFAECQPHYDLRAALPSLRVPVLVTVGRHDWITPVAASEEIAGLVPGARLVVFEESGHSPHTEEPERFDATVLGFLRDVGVLPG